MHDENTPNGETQRPDPASPAPAGAAQRSRRSRRAMIAGAGVAAVVLLGAGVFGANALLTPDRADASKAVEHGSGPASGAATPEGAGAATASPSAKPEPAKAQPERNGGGRAEAKPSSAPAPKSPKERGPDNPFPERAPVEVGAKTKLGNGLVVTVSDLERIEGEAQGPGEIAGPAVRATITVQNTAKQQRPLSVFAINAFLGADRVPAGELSGSGAAPLPDSVAAGKTVTGVYVFSVPDDSPSPVVISIDTDPKSPLIIVPMS